MPPKKHSTSRECHEDETNMNLALRIGKGSQLTSVKISDVDDDDLG